MADPALQGTVPSNNTITNSASIVLENSKNEASPFPLQLSSFKRSVPASCSSFSLFPKGRTVQRETLCEESQQNIAPHKSKRKNDVAVESGSTSELNNFSLRNEDTDKGGNTKRDSWEVSNTRQKQMVAEVSNFEEKRILDTGEEMLQTDISKVRPVRLFNVQSREILIKPQNSCLAINQSGEPSTNISSISRRSVQQSFLPYRNSKLAIFTGGETQNSKTGCASFLPAANSPSTFRTQPISTRKPPLPPGAVTHLKGGLTLKANKAHLQSMSQDSRKRLRVSEITTKKCIPAADSDKKGCVERGNSHSTYRIDSTGSSGALTTKSVMFDKVASAATNPSMNLVTLPDNIQAAFPGSSGQGRSLHQQEISAFSNDNIKKTLKSQGKNESDRKNALSLDHKRKPFQHPQYCVTGKTHFQSFFEEKDKGIREFTVGESSCGNAGAALQVIKGSLQNRSGLLSTTSAPISHEHDPSRSFAASLDDQMPRNIAKPSNQNLMLYKSSKADIFWHDRESSSPDSLATEKSKVNVSMRQTSSPPVHSLQNIVELQVQASRASSTASYSCEAIAESYYNSQTEHCQQIEGGQMASMRIDNGSCNTADVRVPVILSQAEKAPSMSAIKQIWDNFRESAEEYRCGSRSCSIDVEVGKADVEKPLQFDQIKNDVCKFCSRSEGTVCGAGLEVVRGLPDRDLDNSRNENISSEKIISSHHSAQPSILEHQTDADLRSSPEICMDLTQERSKRLKQTSHSGEKMLESSCSEMVVDTRGQKVKIPDQCGVLEGSRDTEAVGLHQRVEITRASKEALGYNRLTACDKDAHEQHCELPVPNRRDAMASCLRKRPRHIDYQVSSIFLDHTTLNHASTGQNSMDPTAHSSKSIALQTEVSSSGKGASPKSQKKIDLYSILSHPWIQRWRPSCKIAPPLCEMRCGSLVNKEINPRSIRQLFGPKKMMPSAAAMAIVGIATRQIPPCQLQKKGSFSVWTAVGCTVNRTVE